MNGPERLNPPSLDTIIVKSVKSALSIAMNRPRQLNALSFDMVSKLLQIFLSYENDRTVQLVIMKGNGKAFSCGGDVVAVIRNTNKVGWKLAAEFFNMEYKINFIMATYRKPQVSILNGIVMGGGAGSSVHGRFRVATENSVFAMPETAIGLFPDVGASYFLSRLPGFFGEYLGLTGARLNGAEMLACGLATHFVPSSALPSLEEALHNANSSDPEVISEIISSFSQHPSLKERSSYRKLDIIDKCFSRRTVEEILVALEENVKESDEWGVETLTSLRNASPISLKISLAAVRKGRVDNDIGRCLIRDFRMACHSLKGDVSNDFFEGCRALLIDKDKMPKWEPSKLEDVTEEMVDKYFSRMDDDEWKDLQFPPRDIIPKL